MAARPASTKPHWTRNLESGRTDSSASHLCATARKWALAARPATLHGSAMMGSGWRVWPGALRDACEGPGWPWWAAPGRELCPGHRGSCEQSRGVQEDFLEEGSLQGLGAHRSRAGFSWTGPCLTFSARRPRSRCGEGLGQVDQSESPGPSPIPAACPLVLGHSVGLLPGGPAAPACPQPRAPLVMCAPSFAGKAGSGPKRSFPARPKTRLTGQSCCWAAPDQALR